MLIRVENTKLAPIDLPPDRKNKIPRIYLVPGGNNVAAAVVQALDSGKGPKGALKRGLAKDWKRYRASHAIKVHSAAESAVLTKKPIGPDHPATLAEYPAEAAEAIVRVTSDVEVLDLWRAAEPRKPVARAIEARLAELGKIEPTAG